METTKNKVKIIFVYLGIYSKNSMLVFSEMRLDSLTSKLFRNACNCLTACSSLSLIFIPDLNPTDFSANSLWKLIHKLYDTWVLIGSSDFFYMFLQLFFKFLSGSVTFCKHNSRLDNLTSYKVRYACNCTFEHGRVLDKGAFHFKRSDLISL